LVVSGATACYVGVIVPSGRTETPPGLRRGGQEPRREDLLASTRCVNASR